MPEQDLRFCSRACGAVDVPHRIARHAKTCWTPRTLERLREIGGASALSGDVCWPWQGRSDVRGTLGRRRVYVLAFEVVNGPVPIGLFVCHRCGVEGCFNPACLYAGTQRQNVADTVRHGRAAGAATWSREERLARGLDGSVARAAAVAARVSRRWDDGRPCAVCGVLFTGWPYRRRARAATCSRACADRARAVRTVPV